MELIRRYVCVSTYSYKFLKCRNYPFYEVTHTTQSVIISWHQEWTTMTESKIQLKDKMIKVVVRNKVSIYTTSIVT